MINGYSQRLLGFLDSKGLSQASIQFIGAVIDREDSKMLRVLGDNGLVAHLCQLWLRHHQSRGMIFSSVYSVLLKIGCC